MNGEDAVLSNGFTAKLPAFRSRLRVRGVPQCWFGAAKKRGEHGPTLNRSRLMYTIAIVLALLPQLTFDPIYAQSSNPGILTPFKFRQSFIPTESYIPDEVALYKKFYEAEGLGVEMLRSTGGSNAASLVAAGNDQVGVAGAADVLIACGKGLDLVAIGINMPLDPTAIVSLSANPIRSIADLRGKRIGVVPGSTSLALLQALLKSNNLGEQDVKLVLIGAGDLISGLMTKRLDAIAAFETTNVPAIRAAGADPVSLRFADVGMRVPGNVYIANGEYSRKNPDIVTRFMAGTIRGWEDVYRNGSSEGLAILVKAYPELATQSAFLGLRWDYREENNYTPYVRGNRFSMDAFKFNPGSIESLNAALVGAGSVQSGINLGGTFTNVFIDRAEQLLKRR
jgi:ABC-type nitrate/sulfonate/bicarbonate transport system substrate-binding protein